MESLISNSTFAILGIVAFFTLLLPLILILFLTATKKFSLTPVLIGAAAFFVSQMVLRLPIMQLVGFSMGQGRYVAMAQSVLGILIIGGLSAGLFEETARLISGKFLLKSVDFSDSVAFGLGHGFCECILLVGMSNISMIIQGISINDGSYLAALQQAMAANPGYYPDDTFQQVLSQYASITAVTAVCSVLERAAAIAFHVFASVLVFKGIRENKLWLWGAALLLHTAFNFFGVMAAQHFGMIWGNIVIDSMGILCLVGILLLKPKTQKREMI